MTAEPTHITGPRKAGGTAGRAANEPPTAPGGMITSAHDVGGRCGGVNEFDTLDAESTIAPRRDQRVAIKQRAA